MEDTADDIIILDPAIIVKRRFLIATSGLNDDELEHIKHMIGQLRGDVDDLEQNQFKSFCTHIISKDFPVTEKILGALASGKWLLHPRYIHDCYKKKRWLDEEDYELPNCNFAARYHRMGRVNRDSAGLYKNLRVYIKLAQKSHTRAFRRVMAAGEADILLKEDFRSANMIITDMQHYELIAQQVPANSNIVGIDYIKDTLINKTPLEPQERHFLKNSARYQGTPRKPEAAGTSSQGTLSQYVSNKGYTPIKMLHRIKKEPEDGITAVDSSSQQMRKSILPQNYRNIGTYFKKEDKDRIIKIDTTEESGASLNQSSDGDLQIINDYPVIQKQPTYVMPSSSKHHQSSDAIEIMWVKPVKKRKESFCEIVDVEDVEITPSTSKNQGIRVKNDIDLTVNISPREGTFAKQSFSTDTSIISILDSPSAIPVSPPDFINSSTPSEIHVDSLKRTHDGTLRDLHVSDKETDSFGLTGTTTDLPADLDTALESPEVPIQSVRVPVSPVISTIPGRIKTRPAAIPTGGSSLRYKESVVSKPSSMSPTPRIPISPSRVRGSVDSSSGMSVGSTSSSPLGSMSPMEHDMSSEEQANRTSGSESISSFTGFLSPERMQRSTDKIKQSEGEMEISYNSSPSDVHPLDRGTKIDRYHEVTVKRPSPQKLARKPLLPIDLSNCGDTVLSPNENRLPPLVIRKEQYNSLILTLMHKENQVSRTVFSDTTDLCAHNDVEVNLNKSTPPREMSVKETSRYECSMDDTLKITRPTIKEQEIIVQGIEYLHVALTPEAFPSPILLGHLMRRLVWQETRFPIIHSRAQTLVYRVLDFHPPSCTKTRNLWLSTLRYAGSTEEQDAGNSWTYIKEVICSTLDMNVDQDDSSSDSSGGDEMIYKSMNSVRILDIIQAILQEDLRHWDNRAESMKDLMCIRIFWGERDRSLSNTSAALRVSPQISRLLRLWVKSSQAPPHIRELIARLVGLVLNVMWRCSGTHLVPVSPLPEPLLPLAREIIIRLREVTPGPGMSRGFELLRLIQDLTDPWQRTVVLTILFKSVTQSSNIKFTLADLLDYGKFVGLEEDQKTQEKTNSSSKHTSKSKKSSSSSVRDSDYLSPHRVNKTNNKGETPLMRACITNKLAEMYKLLAVPGININKRDHNGWTALHEASMRGHNTCVELLLQYKPDGTDEFVDRDGRCDVMKRGTENGRTALHDAVASNMVETVKLLLDHAGDRLLKVKTKENETAYDLATESEVMRQVLNSYRGKKGKIDMTSGTPETAKRTGGLQLSQLSHTSLLKDREECQAFLLLILNAYLNTTGFRFLWIEIKRGVRRSTSLMLKQHLAQLMKNEEVSNKKVPEPSSDKDEDDIMTGQIDDSHFKYNSCEKDTKGTDFTLFRRKIIKDIPKITNSHPLESYDDISVPSDKAEAKKMNEIFNGYRKDEDTLKTRKEEFRKEAVDTDFFNSLNFILQ